ncbi:hypothetical protein AA21291_1819 [Swaminathania salitolerans LMG 21291]|uniref:Uncharacterized protein n=1 Tax=Swaminathania salitolerans TaxID=182838 RepID=A0A511BRP3_9PROT|nr:hypothetical protein AA21291_1819 [Swaminathania salitolerans LMG 21291]GEL03011.1 hypothetical protein SSA02_21740 [Swaminathania salitolerans]
MDASASKEVREAVVPAVSASLRDPVDGTMLRGGDDWGTAEVAGADAPRLVAPRLVVARLDAALAWPAPAGAARAGVVRVQTVSAGSEHDRSRMCDRRDRVGVMTIPRNWKEIGSIASLLCMI